MLRAGNAARRVFGRAIGASFAPEAQALFAAMTTTPSGARQKTINTLIVALKAAGIWSKLDVLWVTAAADSQAARLNWINPATFTLSPVNSPTFAVDRGYTGDGSTSRLNPTWIPSTNGVNYTQTDASVWLWSRTAGQGTVRDIGSDATNGPRLNARNGSDLIAGVINDEDATAASSTDGSGLVGLAQNGSTKRYFRNGAQVGTDISSVTAGLGTGTVWLLGANNTSFSTRQQALAAFGASLTGKEAALYNAVLAYMQAVGAG